MKKFDDCVLFKFEQEKNQHIVSIKFTFPLVRDKLDYKDPDDKGQKHKVEKGKKELKESLLISKGGRFIKKSHPHNHSTVTDLAKFLGLSIS